MMTLRLTKQFDFQMAHALSGYDGKCRNLHGHNYRLLVTISGRPIADTIDAKRGMVMDFGDLRQVVTRCVVEPFDHALVVPKGSAFAGITETKLITTDFQPTCENLLIHFAGLLEGQLPEGVSLHSLRLYETEGSYAELFLD